VLYFRSESSRIEKTFVPRLKVWILVIISFLAGYIFSDIRLINFNINIFISVSVLIFLSFIPLLFLKKDRKRNFYYGLFITILDPLCISALMIAADSYHHIFIFLYVISLLFSGLLLNRAGLLLITAINSILFVAVVKIAGFEVNSVFQVAVVLMFFVFSLSLISLRDYFKNIIRHLRIKDKNISVLEFFNVYLIDNMHNGLVVVNENQKISFLNESAGKILNKKAGEVGGEDLKNIFPDISEFCGKKPSEHIEIWKLIDGKNKCITAKISPVHIENDFVGNIIIFDDITGFKESQRINEQNRRLAAIGRLAAALAHELRNPLASISASVEMIGEDTNDAADRKRLMKIIVREIDSLNVLISELLDFVKPIRLNKKDFNINKLLYQTIDLIKFEKKIGIQTVFEDDVIVYGDQNKLKQVFLNILKNAMHDLNENEGKIVVGLRKTIDGRTLITFEDNGPGIPRGNLEKIFEPFFTTRESGTGLGLPTCHNIIVMHGGKIEVKSIEGKTEFRVII